LELLIGVLHLLEHLVLHPLEVVHRILVISTYPHILFKFFITALHAGALRLSLRALLLPHRKWGEHAHCWHHHWHWVEWRLQSIEPNRLLKLVTRWIMLGPTITFSGWRFLFIIFLDIFNRFLSLTI
jgi:hypothetical protein